MSTGDSNSDIFAEDFIVSHMKTIQDFHLSSRELFIFLENDGKYSVVYSIEPDKKYITEFDSSEYLIGLHGNFVVFWNNSLTFLWNKKVLLETDGALGIIDHYNNNIFVDLFSPDTGLFINSNDEFHHVQLSNFECRNIMLFSESVFMCYKWFDSYITLYFYNQNLTPIISFSYNVGYKIYRLRLLRGSNMFMIKDRNRIFNFIKILPDYTIRNHGRTNYFSTKNFTLNPHDNILYHNNQIITIANSIPILISDNVCFYNNKENAVIRKYTGTSIILTNKFVKYILSKNSFMTERINSSENKTIIDIYKIQLYDQHFTKSDNFYKLLPSKRPTIYALMLIYKYIQSDLRRLPFEILFYLFSHI